MSRPPAQQPAWKATLDRAFAKLNLAETYADDGAFLTAAQRAEEAAALFRQGAQERSQTGGGEP